MVTPAAFADSPWRKAVKVIDCRDFKPRVRSWMLHRPPAGRLSRPIAVFRDALIEDAGAVLGVSLWTFQIAIDPPQAR